MCSSVVCGLHDTSRMCVLVMTSYDSCLGLAHVSAEMGPEL